MGLEKYSVDYYNDNSYYISILMGIGCYSDSKLGYNFDQCFNISIWIKDRSIYEISNHNCNPISGKNNLDILGRFDR